MNMGPLKKPMALLILILAAMVGSLLFFQRMYHNDVKALTGFVASYEQFDHAISAFSVGSSGDLESKVGDALVELDKKAALGLSSLIKHDAELMDQARRVADLCGRELESLKACKAATRGADMGRLVREYDDLTSQRKAAYARFQGLGPAGG